jgi:DNA polymerase delta subunit 2
MPFFVSFFAEPLATYFVGTIIAALGKENSYGEFEVVDICTPGLPDPNPTPRMEIGKWYRGTLDMFISPLNIDFYATDTPENKYVALLSGLNFGSGGESSIRTEMLLEYLTGELGGSQVCSSPSVEIYVTLLTC